MKIFVQKYRHFLLCMVGVYLAVALISCGSSDLSHTFKDEKWIASDTVTFQHTVEKGQTPVFRIENTYTDAYPFQNIYLKIWAKSPSGKTTEYLALDTLIRPAGEWRVAGSSPHLLPFVNNPKIDFSETGNYTVKLIQYMRKDTLEGVQSLGIRLQ